MMNGIRRRSQTTKSMNTNKDTVRYSSAKDMVLPIHVSRKTIRTYQSTINTIVIATFFAMLLCCSARRQSSGAMNTVDENHRQGSSSKLLRISASDHSNITQFFPCVNDVFMPGSTSKSDIERILKPERKKSKSPSFTSLPCAPPSKTCFRGVYDIFDSYLNDVHENFADHQLHREGGDPGPMDGLLNSIAMLMERLILQPGVPLTLDDMQFGEEPTILEHSIMRQKNYSDVVDDDSVGARNYGQLHGDYFERGPGFLYTAILYDDPPDDLIGGETAMVDLTKDTVNKRISFGMEMNKTAKAAGAVSRASRDMNNEQTIDFNSGVIVEPKRGRLLLFSGGGENFHAPMEVKRGMRPTYHFWFKCKAGLKGKVGSHSSRLV